MLESTKRISSRFLNKLCPLFPGYIFVAYNAYNENWHKIDSTFGVSKILKFNNKPGKVPDKLINGLKNRCDNAGKLLLPDQLSKGDNIEVLSGPFANFLAKIDTIDSENRIWALIRFMGESRRCQIRPEKMMFKLSD